MPTNYRTITTLMSRFVRWGRVSMLGSACLMMSCSGSTRSGPSPVSLSDDDAMPTADMPASAKNAVEPEGELRALLDAQDPSMWSVTGSARRETLGGSEDAVVLDAPTEGVGTTPSDVGTQGTADLGDTAAAGPVGNTDAPSPDVVIDAATATRPASTSATGESPSLARERLVGEIAGVLRSQSQSGGSPDREGLGLLALELLEPGSVDAELAAYTTGLSPAESRSFESLRGLFRTLNSQTSQGGGAAFDSGRLQAALSRHATQLGEGEPLLISSAALCSSVDGYGRYSPLKSTTFVHGRPHPVILYLSIDHVTQQEVAATPSGPKAGAKKLPAKKSTIETIKSAVDTVISAPAAAAESKRSANIDDGIDWTIDLTQSATLYHDSDNLSVFSFGAQTLRDRSRDRRRDFCIARRIEIPANLSLGRYNLKVLVRDQAGNASAEAIIPIQIVAETGVEK